MFRSFGLVLFLLVGLALLCSRTGIASKNGALQGYTGAPAENGANCTACHSGTANTGPGSLQILVTSNQFAPGSVIPVRVSLLGQLQSPKNGYQMAAYDSNSQAILSGWSTPDATVSAPNGNYIGHGGSGNLQSSWLTYLQTPAAAFSLYAAGNDANDNRVTTGDLIYTTSQSLSPASVPLYMTTVPSVGSTVSIEIHSAADAGKTYYLAASLSNSGVALGGQSVPLGIDSILLMTVNNVLPSIFQSYQGVLDGAGRASPRLALLNDPGLKGITLYHAFIVIDPATQTGIGTISNGLPITII